MAHASPAEARLETFGPRALPEYAIWEGLQSWWLAHRVGANTPNWDLAATATIEGRKGLILAEAKANVPELGEAGKSLGDKASERSSENHARIGQAIAEAQTALSSVLEGVNISRGSHYQLANRVAFMWKLASLGIPTVLVYLGFTGDEGHQGRCRALSGRCALERTFPRDSGGLIPLATMAEVRLLCVPEEELGKARRTGIRGARGLITVLPFTSPRFIVTIVYIVVATGSY